MRALHIVILVVVGLIAVGAGFAEEYVGRIGDVVSYRTGALILTETDVTLPGRRGLGVEITRHYNSQNYSDSIVAGAGTAVRYEEYGTYHDYLGQGWHIEYPCLWENDTLGYTKAIRYRDGSTEILLVNTDTLTDTNWPLRTRAGALATDNFPDTVNNDELLLTDGTKWVFALRVDDRRLLTNIVNRFGDTTHVSYFSGTDWIEKVTSPIGLEVLFQYGAEDTLYVGAPPADTVRLCRLKYLNHDSNYVEVKYDYDWSEQGGLLTKVVHPNGDTTVYGYSHSVKYQDVADYWDTSGAWADTIDYDNDNSYSADDLYFLKQIDDAAGATVQYTYRCFTVPIINSGDTAYVDSCGYQGRIGVNRRIADNDTVFIRYEMSYPGLHTEDGNSTPVTRVTTVDLPGGGKEEYWYFSEKEDDPGGVDAVFGPMYEAGYHPGALFQRHAIYDGDTTCTGYGYAQEEIGEIVSKLGEDTAKVMAVDEVWAHRGVDYWWPQYGWDGDSTNCFQKTSSKDWWSTYSALDWKAAGLLYYSVAGERETDTVSVLGAGDYASSDWIPSPFPTDDVSFRVDSVTSYRYIPSLNIAVIDEVWDFQQNDTMPFATTNNYTYDSANSYVMEKAVTTLDPDYSTDTLVNRTTEFLYDDSLMLGGTITPYGDTTYYEWDPTYYAFLWKRVDSSLGTLVTNEYYINGLMKRSIGLNSDTTEIYYDSIDRAVGCRLPLETDTSAIKTFDSDSNKVTLAVKIDSGLTSMTRVYQDNYYRPIMTALEVNDSTDIIDSIVYNDLGLIEKTHRPRYADSGTFYWTQYYYDQSLQKVKTLAVDGTSDTSEVIDVYTGKYTDFRGNVTIRVKDILGLTLIDTLITLDSSDTLVTTYGYDKHNKIIANTGRNGMTRYLIRDDWGRVRKILDSTDVGTFETWRDSLGNLRLARHNTDTLYNYFKYDSDKRLLEEGTVYNADTSQIDTQTYPSSGNTISLSNRYDTYSDGDIFADTAGGLGCRLGRLTEQRCYQYGVMVGYDYLYYDARGRIGLKTTWVTGMTDPLKLRYEYYANNALKKVIYPDTTETEYSLSQSGRIKGISGVIGIDSIEYEPWGPVKKADFVNSLTTRNEFDSLSRITKTLNYSTYMNLFSREYQYTDQYLTSEYDLDSDGDTTNLGEVRAFAYDTLGRLVSAFMEDPNESADTGTITYDYDISNNLNTRYFSDDDTLTYTRFDGRNCDSLIEFSSDSTWDFSRNDLGQLTTIEKTSSGPLWDERINYAYDHRGLVTSFEYEPRILQFGDAPDSVVNLYNGAGQKVKQTHIYRWFDVEVEPRGGWVRVASDHYYIWSGSRVVLELENSDSVTYVNVYGLGQRLMQKNLDDASADSTNHYVADYHGSIRSFVDSRGMPGDRMIEYYPYGELYSQGGLGHTTNWFIGKEKDQTEELDFGPRYYGRNIGRFLAPDPILAGPSPYSYAEGNPVMMSDPSGLAPTWGNMNTSPFLLKVAVAAAQAEFSSFERRRQAAIYVHRRIGFDGGSLPVSDDIGFDQGSYPFGDDDMGLDQGSYPFGDEIGMDQGSYPFGDDIGLDQGSYPFGDEIGMDQGSYPFGDDIGFDQGSLPVTDGIIGGLDQGSLPVTDGIIGGLDQGSLPVTDGIIGGLDQGSLPVSDGIIGGMDQGSYPFGDDIGFDQGSLPVTDGIIGGLDQGSLPISDEFFRSLRAGSSGIPRLSRRYGRAGRWYGTRRGSHSLIVPRGGLSYGRSIVNAIRLMR